MNFGIVGPISKDHIVLPAGKIMDKFGAAAYSTFALTKLLEGTTDQIICLSHTSDTDINVVTSLLHHPNVNLSGLTAFDKESTEIELTYTNEHEHQSRQISSMHPLKPVEMDLLSDCAAVLLLPLNETDISLECVRHLRETSSAIIFLDAHGLVTGLDESGRRYKKPWQNTREWFKYIDILKMNEYEASLVAGYPLNNNDEFAHFASTTVQNNLQVCWITFGDQSSLVAWRRNGGIFWANVPVITEIGPIVDTTGCGDASSAGFIYPFIKFHQSALGSVIMGNTLGSIKATFAEINEFPSRPEIKGFIGNHYRDFLHTLLDDYLEKSQLIIHEIKGGNEIESFVYGSVGDGYSLGSNHARGSGGQGPPN
jgi:sugar/nucleoside kinase (ribokinase family)